MTAPNSRVDSSLSLKDGGAVWSRRELLTLQTTAMDLATAAHACGDLELAREWVRVTEALVDMYRRVDSGETSNGPVP